MGNTTNLNKLTKIPLPNNVGKVEKIACGWPHSLLVNDKNEMYGCGYNGQGALGLGNYTN